MLNKKKEEKEKKMGPNLYCNNISAWLTGMDDKFKIFCSAAKEKFGIKEFQRGITAACLSYLVLQELSVCKN